MKCTSIIITSITSLVIAATPVFSGVQVEPKNTHLSWGLGMALSQVPFSMSKLKLPLSYYSYDHQFTDPRGFIRSSVELGLYGFNVIIPVPTLGSNLYFGSEEADIQGKIGLGGFYDIAVGGHAGVVAKAGLIMKNRFGIDLFVVPTGLDSKKSYTEVLGIESKSAAEQGALENGGKYVIMPYFGFMLTIRN